ncbi:MAG: aminotransferase class I/II-fold pyridoxal phosphate-dependent enzyme, partial [Lentisphaeria bacterium]|nr:aminotransferase class I/II-fold pyridoxal phosphate-dependent enzyme [Lentisphaeria bacterium]
TFSITGWRLGYAAGPEAFCRRIGIANDLMYICAPTPLQVGLAKGMAALDDGYYTRLADEYRHKRDFFCGQLASFGLTPCVPRGAYYVLADVSGLGFDDDVAAAMHILETAGVACVPGSSFFASDGSTGLVRFCYAKETSVLEEACARLESAL